MLIVQALERAGVDTVFMTEEEDNENGNAPPLLMSTPEIVSGVNTGTAGVEITFPKVDRFLGLRQPHAAWYEEKPPIQDRYGVITRTTSTASASGVAWITEVHCDRRPVGTGTLPPTTTAAARQRTCGPAVAQC